MPHQAWPVLSIRSPHPTPFFLPLHPSLPFFPSSTAAFLLSLFLSLFSSVPPSFVRVFVFTAVSSPSFWRRVRREAHSKSDERGTHTPLLSPHPTEPPNCKRNMWKFSSEMTGRTCPLVFKYAASDVSDAFRMHSHLEELLTKLLTTFRRICGYCSLKLVEPLRSPGLIQWHARPLKASVALGSWGEDGEPFGLIKHSLLQSFPPQETTCQCFKTDSRKTLTFR